MLTKILIVIGAIIVLLLLSALFVKKDYVVEEEININKPVTEVFEYIKLLRNQEQYSKWVMLDPNMRKNFKGMDGQVGYTYAWDSDLKQAGKGEQEITGINNNQQLDCEVRFEKPFKNTAHTYMTTFPTGASATTVTWGMKGRNPYPANLMNLFIPGILGKDLKESLINLKTIMEK